MSLFSEFVWKSWETIGSSPAFPGKAGIEFFGLIIYLAAFRDEKQSYREAGLKKIRLFNITWDRPFFQKIHPGLEAVLMFYQDVS